MGDEQSGFKVTDRRLFNADGSPRDIQPSVEPDKAATATTEPPQPAAPVAPIDTETSGATAPQTSKDEPDQASAAEPTQAGDQAAADEGDADEANLPGATDPASFINFLMSLATNAAAALGMMPHPGTGESGVDLQLAKHWIDVLGMLQERTRGNLDPREDQVFEGILADLRMQYVSLTSSPAQQKFTGRDIIGGK
jgi:hypothetical protein